MQTTDTTINPAPSDSGGLLGRIKEMLAYIVCPVGRRPPTSCDIARLTASPFDRFHVGAVRLIKAAARMFARGADRELTKAHPWDYLGHMERGEGTGVYTGQDSFVQSRMEFDATMAQEDERLDRLEKGLNHDEVVGLEHEPLNVAHTSCPAVANDRVVDAQSPERAVQPSCVDSTRTGPVCLSDELIMSIEEFLDELQSDDRNPLPLGQSPPRPMRKAEVRRSSNKVRPLRKQVLKRLLPKFTKRAAIPTRRDTKAPGSVKPRDSVDSPRVQAVSPHLSIAGKREVRRKPGYSCLRPEAQAAAAPNHENPSRPGAYEHVELPARKHVAEAITVASQLDTSVGSSNMLPGSAAQDATRKIALAPPNTLKTSRDLNLASLQAAIDATAALQAFIEDEYSIPSRSCSPIEEESDSEALPTETFASRRSKVAHGRPTCMGDWLAQLGTGTNMLVEDEIAAQAAQLVEIMRPSFSSPSPMSTPSPSASSCTSGSSTPNDSPPITPTSAVEPVSACFMAEKTEAARRSRARCSYDGGVFDTVVALELPEELLTEEVGVAC